MSLPTYPGSPFRRSGIRSASREDHVSVKDIYLTVDKFIEANYRGHILLEHGEPPADLWISTQAMRLASLIVTIFERSMPIGVVMTATEHGDCIELRVNAPTEAVLMLERDRRFISTAASAGITAVFQDGTLILMARAVRSTAGVTLRAVSIGVLAFCFAEAYARIHSEDTDGNLNSN